LEGIIQRGKDLDDIDSDKEEAECSDNSCGGFCFEVVDSQSIRSEVHDDRDDRAEEELRP